MAMRRAASAVAATIEVFMRGQFWGRDIRQRFRTGAGLRSGLLDGGAYITPRMYGDQHGVEETGHPAEVLLRGTPIGGLPRADRYGGIGEVVPQGGED